MSPNITLNYGQSLIEFEISQKNLYFLIDKNYFPALENPCQTLKLSLKNPIGARPLSKIVRKGYKVLIVGDDIARITPTRLMIPLLLDELNSLGIPDEDIEVLIGNGTHRMMKDEEIREKYGEGTVNRVKITNHDYRDQNGLVNLGETKSGIPIVVNRKVIDADFVIGVGNISPHFYAGWGGGGKIIQPGISGEKTTVMTHLIAGKTKPIFQIVGNVNCVVRKEIDETAKKAGLRFIVNTVLNKDDKIAYLATGDPIKAFREGVKCAKKIFCSSILGFADVTLISSFPYDIDYWQADKALTFASMATKQGGTVIFITPCDEGISPTHPTFKDKAKLTYEELIKEIENHSLEDLVAASELLLHSQIMERVNVLAVSSGLSYQDKRQMGFEHAETIETALEKVLEDHGKNAKIGVIKRGDIVPIINSQFFR